MHGGFEPGVSGVLRPENSRRSDDGVVSDIQKLTNRLHGTHRVPYKFFVRDHEKARVPLVLGHDPMREPPGERQLKNRAGGFLFQGRSDHVAWVPAYHENSRVGRKPPQKCG